MLVIFASCENESTEDSQTLEQRELILEDEIIVSDGEEDDELMFTDESEILRQNNSSLMVQAFSTNSVSVTQSYTAIDADRDPFGSQQPQANFWWSETPDATDYFNASTYYSAAEGANLQFTEYSNGTASIVGTTISGTCVVNVNVWLKDKKTWAEWSSEGGEHKKEGTAGNASDETQFNFYVIDSENSTVTATGDCPQTGTFGVEQRPDPNDLNTPNYGSHVGPGGANYDSNIGELGLSSWGWLTDINTGERLWKMDFNFRIVPNVDECNDCEGKVTDLTLNWDWHNPYRVRVYQRVENTCYATKIFDQTVNAGEDFSFSGTNHDGTIGTWAYIYVGNCYYTKIRTNCDINIGPGYVKGVLEVVSGNSSNGGELCEYVQPDYHCYRHWGCRYSNGCRYY